MPLGPSLSFKRGHMVVLEGAIRSITEGIFDVLPRARLDQVGILKFNISTSLPEAPWAGAYKSEKDSDAISLTQAQHRSSLGGKAWLLAGFSPQQTGWGADLTLWSIDGHNGKGGWRNQL